MFFISGIWHGTGLTFIVWGIMHGILQIIEKLLGIDPKGKVNKSVFFRRLKPLRVMITFVLVNIAWILFRSPTISDAFNYIHLMIPSNAEGLSNELPKAMMIFVVVIVFVKEFIEEYLPKITLFNNRFTVVRWSSYLIVLSMIALFGVLDSTQFIYVSF